MPEENAFTRLSGQLPGWTRRGLNESQTSQAIVLPLLQELGFDIWDPYEVVAEDHSGGGSGGYCPDFTIKLEGTTTVIIEVKSLNKSFSANDETQAVNYVNALGRRWAVLTNGRAWHFYDNSLPRPATEKLVLTVDIQDEEAGRYLGQLLSRAFWLTEDAEKQLSERIEKVDEDIRKRHRLEEMEHKLRQELVEGFTKDSKGLQKAIQLTLEPNERELAEEAFDELALRLLSVDSYPPAELTDSTNLTEAITKGIAKTSPEMKNSRQTSLQAWINDKELPARNWRDIHSGLAEALILLKREKILEETGLLYSSNSERRKKNGEVYPAFEYRKLSSGKYLFLNASAKDHRRRSRQLLEQLNAPSGLIRVLYKDEEYFLP